MSDQQIQRVKVKRLARVGLWTTDAPTLARFYYQVLGLDLRATSEAVAEQQDGGGQADANMFLGLGSEHHCLGLYNDTRPAPGNSRRPVQRTPLHHLTFEVDSAAELAALAARLNLANIAFTFGPNESLPDLSDSLWTNDPDGNRIEIAVAPEEIPLASHTPGHTPRSAPRPLSLQHIGLYTQQLETLIEFYTEALGFDISDWLLRERAWLRCNTDHHTLLLIQGIPGIDHVGYNITNGAELLRWADHLSAQQVPLLWGPGRHGAGNDLFLRFSDAEGFHLELSTEMQQYYDRDVTIPPRLWHTRTMALNLWGVMPSWLREEATV
jgi:catechol-2,3-dioxygenase